MNAGFRYNPSDDLPKAAKASPLFTRPVCGERPIVGAQDERDLDPRLSGRMPLVVEEGGVVGAPGNPAPDPRDDGRDPWTKAVGNIETASGMRYDFRNPDPDTVILKDIAAGLSKVCRFGAQTWRFDSVAEHSVLVSRIVEARGGDQQACQAALLHDGHENFIWDAPSPLKPLLGDVFKELADLADDAIAGKFLLNHRAIFKLPIIKAADYTALVVEARALLPVGPTDAEWEPLPAGVGWNGGLASYDAERLFMDRARELGLS